MEDQHILAIVSLVSVIAGALSGSYFSYLFSMKLNKKQFQRDSKIRAYSKLMGLKIPISQTAQTLLEAKSLSEYYERQFQLTGNVQFLEDAKRENARSISLIPNFTQLIRETFELIGEIQIVFEMNIELVQAIDSIYNYKSVNIIFPDANDIGSTKNLQAIFNKANEQAKDLIKSELTDRIERVLSIIKNQVSL